MCTSSEAGTLVHQAGTPQLPYMVSEQDVELVIRRNFVCFFFSRSVKEEGGWGGERSLEELLLAALC